MKNCETCKHWVPTVHAGECTHLNTDEDMMLYVLIPLPEDVKDEEVTIMTDWKFVCSEWALSNEYKHRKEIVEDHERTYEETLEQRQRIQEYLKSKGRI